MLFSNQLSEVVRMIHDISAESTQMLLDQAVHQIYNALIENKSVLVCGNGGSAADSQHIAGELVGKFFRDRRALNVRSLSVDTSIITSWANDVDYDTVFSRQVEAYGESGGILWGLSTSGNSKNVLNAAIKAKEKGMFVIGMTGMGGGSVASIVDLLIDVPSNVTPRIQELHMMMYHYICENVEIKFTEEE